MCWITIGIADLSAIIYYLQFFNKYGMPLYLSERVMISVAAIVFIMGLNLVTVNCSVNLSSGLLCPINYHCGADWVKAGLWMIFTGLPHGG